MESFHRTRGIDDGTSDGTRTPHRVSITNSQYLRSSVSRPPVDVSSKVASHRDDREIDTNVTAPS